MIRRGIVVAVDEKTARVRVQMPDLDNVVSNWLPVVHHKTQKDKAYWLPDIGEYVIVAFDEEGEHSDGYVLGAIYNNKDTPPVANRNKFFVRFEDGTEIEYDKKTHILRVKAQTVQIQAGTVIIESNVNINGSLNVSGGGAAVNIVGNLEVIGNIHATGSIIDEGGNTNHHSH
ncbi:phage baseplate assembly protein V [Thermocrinis sp.]|jgi:phage baseplate assembly protein V|uniref:phage baseplate assembly protein V n=1 Tax=Thermocrinis sp. TaxID=2024383 RepID=UPI003C08A8BE